MILSILFAMILATALVLYVGLKIDAGGDNAIAGCGVFGAIGSFILLIFSVIGTIEGFSSQAKDVAVVRGQQEIISIYEDRRTRVLATLTALEPKVAPLTLNADSPIKSLIEQVADSESRIAAAEQTRAEARIRIQARKLGLFSFVVGIVGEQ